MSAKVVFSPRIILVAAALIVSVSGAFAYSDPAQVAQLRKTKVCAQRDLSGADLRGADLRAADLTSANLNGANLYKTNLTAAKLDGADLRNADMRGTNLRGASGALFVNTKTDNTTTCPAGTAGPCK